MNLLPDGLRGRYFLAFSPDTSPEMAAARFLQRFGRPPEWILDSLGILFVGPVPREIRG